MRCSSAASASTSIVAESLEHQLLVQRPHVVPVNFEPAADVQPRDTRV